MTTKQAADQATKAMLESPKKEAQTHSDKDFLSFGVTLLDLGCYGRTKCGMLKGRVYRLMGRPSSGKAQPLDAKVLTPSGWKRMGNLKLMDEVIDPDGGIGHVKGIYPQGEKQTFRVVMSDGTSTRCCSEHLWLVENKQDRRTGKTRIMNCLQLQESIGTAERLYVPTAVPVSFSTNYDLPIHPYLLGVLLGNGHLGRGKVYLSSVEEEIISKVKDLIPEDHNLTHKKKGDYAITYKKGHSNKVINALRSLGLDNCRSHTKFIPREYLLASKEDRIALLNGLMDTDGYINATGYMDYCTASPRLSNGVKFLIRSLGGMAHYAIKKNPKYTYKGEKRIGKDCHRIFITLPDDISPFTLARKANRTKAKIRTISKKIVDVQEFETEECQCISVTTKRGLYITDGFIVTHNTFLARQLLCEAALNPEFDDYELVYDDVERGALMDTAKFFPPLLKRLVPPARTKSKEPIYSKTVDDFFVRLRKRLDAGKKVIWVEDSLDVLTGINETKMGDGKAKFFSGSKGLRSVLDSLEATGSILILVSQARANIGNVFSPDTTSGGRALEHAATLEIWLYKAGAITKKYKSQDKTKVTVGNWITAKIAKNRISGPPSIVRFPLYINYGIDDLGSNINYLLDTEHWEKGKGGIIAAPEFKFEGTATDLIKFVEKENKQRELQLITAKMWKIVQQACQIERTPKYG